MREGGEGGRQGQRGAGERAGIVAETHPAIVRVCRVSLVGEERSLELAESRWRVEGKRERAGTEGRRHWPKSPSLRSSPSEADNSYECIGGFVQLLAVRSEGCGGSDCGADLPDQKVRPRSWALSFLSPSPRLLAACFRRYTGTPSSSPRYTPEPTESLAPHPSSVTAPQPAPPPRETMSDDAAHAQADQLKQQGNDAYKKREFQQARDLYQQCVFSLCRQRTRRLTLGTRSRRAWDTFQDVTYLNNLAGELARLLPSRERHGNAPPAAQRPTADAAERSPVLQH